jgi:restriction system protein
MAVPSYDNLTEPLFRAMHELGGSASIDELEEKVSAILNLSEDDLSEIHRDNTTKFSYRLAWARTALKRYGVLTSVNVIRGVFRHQS